MAGNLGTLTLDLIAKIGGFTGPLDKAGRQAKGFQKQMNDMSRDMRVVALNAAVQLAQKVIGLGQAFFEMSKQTAQAVDEMVNMADAIGITVQSLDRLINVGRLQNIEASEIAAAMQKLSKAFEEANDPASDQAKIFKALSDATGKNILGMKDMSEILRAVSDGFSKFEAGTTRTAAATELFGRSGQRLLTLFSKSEEELAALTAEAEKFGGVLSDLEADKLRKVDQAMDHLGLAMQSLKRAVADTSTSMVESLALTIKGLGDFIAFEERFVAHMKGGGVEFGRGPFDFNVDHFVRVEDFMERMNTWLPRSEKAVNDLNDATKKLTFPKVDPEEVKRQEQLLKSVATLTKELRTPLEAWKDSLDGLNVLLFQGGLEWETYSRAVQKANDELADAIGMAAAKEEVFSKLLNPPGKPQFFSADGLFSSEEAKRQEQLLKSVVALTKELRTPLEAWNDSVADLNILLFRGGLEWETYSRAVQKANDELAEAIGMDAAKWEVFPKFLNPPGQPQFFSPDGLFGPDKDLKKLKDEGVDLMKSLSTEAEKYAAQLARINLLYTKSAITQQEWDRARSAITATAMKDFQAAPEFNEGGPLGLVERLDEEQKELDRWQAEQLKLLNDYRAAKVGTEEEWNAKERELAQKHADETGKIEAARTKLILSASSDLFGSLAELSKNFQGESSSNYRALFALSKSFAIAEATISVYQAIAKASASGPFPANLAAMAVVAAATASLVSQIASVGMAHEGMDFVPKSGTWLLEKGERVTTEKTSKRLDRTLARIEGEQQPGRAGGQGGWNVNINEAPGTMAEVKRNPVGGLDVNIALIEERLLERVNRGAGLAGAFDRRYGRKY